MIILPGIHAIFVNFFRTLKLSPQICGIQLTWKIRTSCFNPGIFIYFTTEKLASIGSLFTYNLCRLNIRRISDQKRTALSHADIFCLMKTKAAIITNGTKRFPLICTHNSLCRILDNLQIIFLRNCHNRIHLTGNSRIMNRNNCLCFFRNGFLDLGFIYIHRIRTNINKNSRCTTQYKSICRRYKCIRRHDDFVSRLNF